MLPSLCFLFLLACSVHAGEECGSKKIMYFFDNSRMTCFPIETVQCSPEAKERFTTQRDCQARSIPMDYNTCAANSPAVKRPNGESHCFREGMPLDNESNRCPAGSVCNVGMNVGMCCDKKIQDEYYEEAKATCSDGKKSITSTENEFNQPLVGKKCSHNFCPSGSACKEGKYLAWCCK
ncbi:hypothetical protein PMAYCL1PPCAC_21300 [Pristionchus mayeri]|uniref:BPTI/Kunitz inhibitor domain-containing protein n=1 Tax=Pristionchus mayeri TaxID=1317129 RepID=A0AAN5I4I7_9BILA|nr:hypothetical protein PMAYCL1PPCAC_21300 [Pristionchus mayeri]